MESRFWRTAVLLVSVVAGGCSGSSSTASQAPTATAVETAPPASAEVSPSVAITAATDEVLDRVKASGKLRIAGPIGVPFVIQDPSGEYDGYDIALLKLAAQDLGVELEIIPAGFDAVVAGLQTNKFDIVPALCDTPEREAVIDFTAPSAEYKLQFYYLKDNPKMAGVASFEDLNKPEIVIGVGTGSAGAALLGEIAPNAEVKEFPGISDADSLQMILAGRIDAAGADWPVTTTSIENSYPDRMTFIPEDMSTQPTTCPVAWGIPKGASAFQAYLTDFIQRQIDNGTVLTLQQKYFTDEYLKLAQ